MISYANIKEVVIIYDSRKFNKITIGDVLRIIKFLNNKVKIYLVVDSDCLDFFDTLFPNYCFDYDSMQNFSNKFFINLEIEPSKYRKDFDICSIININKEIKTETYKLIEYFSNKFSNIESKFINQKKLKNFSNLVVGFNWVVPNDWIIKSYPKDNWLEVEKLLTEKYKLTVSWQKQNYNLIEFLKWIKKCNILISIVGLGCHISSILGIKTILLSGPNDFKESSIDPNIYKILPKNVCEFRPCNLKTGKNNCGCMPYISTNDIISKFKEII